jgi:hypothetical protein
MAMMDPPLSFIFENIPSTLKHHLLFKNKTFCFSKARLSIKNPFHKRVSRKGNQFSKEGNASTV